MKLPIFQKNPYHFLAFSLLQLVFLAHKIRINILFFHKSQWLPTVDGLSNPAASLPFIKQ